MSRRNVQLVGSRLIRWKEGSHHHVLRRGQCASVPEEVIEAYGEDRFRDAPEGAVGARAAFPSQVKDPAVEEMEEPAKARRKKATKKAVMQKSNVIES